jgi:hypothetical protein
MTTPSETNENESENAAKNGEKEREFSEECIASMQQCLSCSRIVATPTEPAGRKSPAFLIWRLLHGSFGIYWVNLSN